MPASKRTVPRWIGLGAFAVVAAGVTYFAVRGPAGSPADPQDEARVRRGQGLYAQHCASCHGASLEGQPDWQRRLPSGRSPAPPHDATGHTWHHPDEVLFGITKHGLVPPYAPAGYASDMPAFAGTLSDHEIRSVLAFIAGHWKSREVLEARARMLRSR